MTSVTLMWKVDVEKEWTYILYFQGTKWTFQADTFLFHKLEDLQPGTEYHFSVVTNFFELDSKAYDGFTVTSKKILLDSDYIPRPVKGGRKTYLLLFSDSFQPSTVLG